MSGPSVELLKQIAKMADLDVTWAVLEYRLGDPNPEYLCELIDKAIDQCATEMGRYPKELGPQGEDQLTVSLILQLKKMGFSASHDATSGGHCDIVITEFGGFLWLGEAKKVTGKQMVKIREGYDQLMDRYSTGLPHQDHGSLVLFCNAPRIDEILTAWKSELSGNYKNVSIEKYDATGICFMSSQPHEKTGRKYIVRHKPISLYFSPASLKATLSTS